MNAPRRIYLDHAATSFPKPEEVHVAVERYQRELGSAVGRSSTRVGAEVQRTVDSCRNRLARLFGVEAPSQVIFTLNGTDALNLALHGFLSAGDHVVCTCWEHNSVLRPLQALAEQRGVVTTVIGPAADGGIDLDQMQQALQQPTRLVCITHASNVTGIVQPVAQIAELAHQAGAKVLVDAAQTAGHLPLSMQSLGADLLACPGHKGLLGPLGTGLLMLSAEMGEQLHPVRQGGTGTTSESDQQPDQLPEKFESGNHNAPGIFGLDASVKWLESQSLTVLQQHEQQLTRAFLDGLRSLSGIDVILGNSALERVGVVSISRQRLEPQVLAHLLDEHFGIETRAGLHCAPRAHAALETLERGGTVRFSFGHNNTQDDVDATLEALGQILAAT